MLVQLAHLCQKSIRDLDTLARYGGEEFVILMPHTDQEDGLVSTERVRATVAQTIFQAEGDHIRVTVSMGVASYCDDRTPNIDALLQRADKALYKAKHAGRNQTSVWDISLDN